MSDPGLSRGNVRVWDEDKEILHTLVLSNQGHIG